MNRWRVAAIAALVVGAVALGVAPAMAGGGAAGRNAAGPVSIGFPPLPNPGCPIGDPAGLPICNVSKKAYGQAKAVYDRGTQAAGGLVPPLPNPGCPIGNPAGLPICDTAGAIVSRVVDTVGDVGGPVTPCGPNSHGCPVPGLPGGKNLCVKNVSC